MSSTAHYFGGHGRLGWRIHPGAMDYDLIGSEIGQPKADKQTVRSAE